MFFRGVVIHHLFKYIASWFKSLFWMRELFYFAKHEAASRTLSSGILVDDFCRRHRVRGLTFFKLDQIRSACDRLSVDKLVPFEEKEDRSSILLLKGGDLLVRIVVCDCCNSIGVSRSLPSPVTSNR